MDKEIIRSALKAVKYPGFSRDIVSFGLVENIATDGGSVSVRIAVTSADDSVAPKIKASCEDVLAQVAGVERVTVDVVVNRPKGSTMAPGGSGAKAMPGVKFVVAVASGKGGVGKSTVATNLACALRQILDEAGENDGVGILDCDIYGPSIPHMMGLGERPEIVGDKILPPSSYGVRVMSMALLVDDNAPVVWRGPMINNAISQFAKNVDWGKMEVLVVDLPPGTGDAQLSLVQTIPVNGALIVTTPQPVAVNVARRGAKMFEKVNVPLFGVVENMSYLDAGEGRRVHIFGEGGGKWAADALETSLLGQIPLDPELREGGDRGIPITIAYPNSPSAQVIRTIAEKILQRLRQ